MRLDLGLIITIQPEDSHGRATTVRMHFIPYEGLDTALEKIGQGTYAHIQHTLGLGVDQVDASGAEQTQDTQPPVVLSEAPIVSAIAESASKTIRNPAEDFAGKAAPEPASVFTESSQPASLPEPLPVPVPVPVPVSVSVPIPAPSLPAAFAMPLPEPASASCHCGLTGARRRKPTRPKAVLVAYNSPLTRPFPFVFIAAKIFRSDSRSLWFSSPSFKLHSGSKRYNWEVCLLIS